MRNKLLERMDKSIDDLLYGDESIFQRDARRRQIEGISASPLLNAFVPGVIVYRHIKNLGKTNLSRAEKIAVSVGLIIGDVVVKPAIWYGLPSYLLYNYFRN